MSTVFTSATLNGPSGISFDSNGNLYIMDGSNYVIRKMTPAGTMTVVAGNGNTGTNWAGEADGTQAISASFGTLIGAVGVSPSGNVVFADAVVGNAIRSILPSGALTTLAGSGGNAGYSGDNNPATSATLTYPTAFVYDTAGNMFISDCVNHAIRMVRNPRLIHAPASSSINKC